MDQHVTIEELIDELSRYARGRKQYVDEGHESAALAALIVQKYGYGLAAATRIILGDRAGHKLLMELDGCLSQIDPKWLENERRRRESKHADLVLDLEERRG